MVPLVGWGAGCKRFSPLSLEFVFRQFGLEVWDAHVRVGFCLCPALCVLLSRGATSDVGHQLAASKVAMSSHAVILFQVYRFVVRCRSRAGSEGVLLGHSAVLVILVIKLSNLSEICGVEICGVLVRP